MKRAPNMPTVYYDVELPMNGLGTKAYRCGVHLALDAAFSNRCLDYHNT